MAIPYPKILTAFTLDSALTLQLYIGAAYGTSIEATIAAGTYFVRWDGQSDDFLRELHRACYVALDASAEAGYNASDILGKPLFSINSDHKVVIAIKTDAGQKIRFKWSEDNGATVAGILGFDPAVDTDVEPGLPKTANWQHAYGWYASAAGQFPGDLIEDEETAQAAQARAIGGQTATQYLASVYGNNIPLRFLARLDTYSRGIGYTTAPVHPYERNRGLECLWRAIRDGTRFCFYRDSQIDTALAEEPGVTDVAIGTSTTIEVTGKAWGTDPQEHAGKLALIPNWDNNSHAMRYFVSSHDANTITVPNSIHNTDAGGIANTAAYLFDQPYQTYVLDLGKMKSFAPKELEAIDLYDIDIPVLRYIA